MAPEVAVGVDAWRASGELRVLAGRIDELRPTADGISARLRLPDSVEREHDRLVVNCTGPQTILLTRDSLVAGLIGSGAVRPEPLGLGFDATADGALITADGAVPRVLWTIGPPRRGNLWETSAIPEIRNQAVVLTRALDAAGTPARISA